jgi:hypothetical protein
VNDARAGGSTHCCWIAGQVSLGYGREDAVFFVADADELNLAVSAEPVDHGIECVPNNAIAAFDSCVREHLPQDVCNFSCQKIVLLNSQHASGFHGQEAQCGFQFRDGFGEFGMLSDSFSQGIQQLMRM